MHQAIVKALCNLLEQEISHFEDRSLLETLIARHESLIAERKKTEMIVGSHLSAMGDKRSERQGLQGDFVELDRASSASRFLIEYVSACPPAGKKVLSTSDYDRILALASEIIGSGFISDTLHLEIDELELKLVPSGRLKYGSSAYAEAVSKFRDDYYDSLADRKLGNIDSSAVMNDEENKLGELIKKATNAEFGLPLDDITFVMLCIALGEYTQENGMGSAEAIELVSYIESTWRMPDSPTVSACERDSIEQVIDHLSAMPRQEFLKPPKPYSAEEVYPWRFNRRLAYLRKPLIRRGPRLFWGRRAVIQANEYIVSLVESGRIKDPSSPEMKQLKGKIADSRGKIYNRMLAGKIEELTQYRVLASVKRFNGHLLARANGDDIGDVDLAVIDLATKTIFPVEAKSFTLAKTPGEVKNELQELFDMESPRSAVNHHMERIKWLADHVPDVLAEFGILDDDISNWTIEPLIVLNGHLLSRYLAEIPFKVMTEMEFLSFLKGRSGSADE